MFLAVSDFIEAVLAQSLILMISWVSLMLHNRQKNMVMTMQIDQNYIISQKRSLNKNKLDKMYVHAYLCMHQYRKEEVYDVLLCKQGMQVMDYICPVYTTATPCFHSHKLTTSNFFVEPATNLNPDIVAHCGGKCCKTCQRVQ